jgi:DNA-binding NarL/FixJ family response regulator
MKIDTIIIDDHLLVNEGLSLILEESGLFKIVDKVYDSRQAVDKCYLYRPKLIILDYNMPYYNGLEIVKKLRSIKLESRIVVVSMQINHQELLLLNELDVDAVILKTTPSKELIGILIEVMSGKKGYFERNSLIIEKESDGKVTFNNKLTKRELEVLRLVKKGYSTDEIARSLELSYYTVETHRKNVNNKMKFKNKIEFYDFLSNI